MSTIEKALQKQRAKQKDKEQSTLEKAADKKAATDAPEPNDTPSAQPAKSSRQDKPTLKIRVDDEHFVSMEQGRKLINEEFRAIKRKVLNNAFGPLSKTLNNPNIIMVTSASPGEGKTFTAVNLALSIALEKDKTVLLVDTDVLRPNVLRTLGTEADEGLMEYLLGDSEDIGEVMYHTSLDTLRVIPAGRTHHLSSELLASEKMMRTVNEFANRYPDRVVIFDTPPLLGINETAILANLAGQAIVVVEEGSTQLQKLSKAVEQLNPDMAKGFVINKSQRTQEEGGYYGYYYYGYEGKV